MRISSIFPAVVTAITAAGFTLTEPAPQPIGVPTDVEVARGLHTAPTAMLLAAFDPLALAPRAVEADVH
jgi:hypothetical protein